MDQDDSTGIPPVGRVNSSKRELAAYDSQYSLAISDLNNLLPRFLRKTVCGQTFVLVESLVEELKRTKSPSLHKVPGYNWESDHERLWKSAIYRTTDGPPTLTEDALSGCTIMFFILLQLGRPNLAPTLLERGLSDSSLPFTRQLMTDKLGNSDVHGLQEFIEGFLKWQYAWCPMKIDLNFGRVDVDEQILPFYTREPLVPVQSQRPCSPHGSTGWIIEIPSELVGKELKEKLDSAKRRVKTRGDDPRCKGEFEDVYVFAMKQFPGDREEAFKKERDAFRAMRDLAGIVQYVGWFQCRNRDFYTVNGTCVKADQKICYCIVLELGSSDFNEVMLEEAPPNMHPEIESWWKQLLGISEALESIHAFEIDRHRYRGWHGDVTPRNILFVQGKYKLADPGEARVRRERAKQDGEPRIIAFGGTREYAAPEKSLYLDPAIKSENKILQTSDVWSLGCVLSVAATFVVLGIQGVTTFQKVRMKEIQRLNCRTTATNAFHDGTVVLPCVTEWHKYLRSVRRLSDVFIEPILNMVDEWMLQPEKERHDAVDVTKRFREILATAEYNDPAFQFAGLKDTLEEIDMEAESSNGDGNMSVANTDAQVEVVTDGFRPSLDSGLRSSEDLLGSISVQPTSQRHMLRPISSRSDPNLQRNLRRIYTDRRDTGLGQGAPEKKKGASEQRAKWSSFGMTPLLTEVQNWCQLEEKLEESATAKGMKALTTRRMRALSKTLGKGKLSFDNVASSIQQSMKMKLSVAELPGEDALAGKFVERDIIFLVDNGWTMAKHWREVKYLLNVLVWRTLGYDDDGLELYFTNPDTKACVLPGPEQDVDNFMEALRDARPKEEERVKTDIAGALDKILQRNREQERERRAASNGNAGVQTPQEERKKTIIILTDAIWEGSPFDKVCLFFQDELDRLKTAQGQVGSSEQVQKTRPITFQFIGFGCKEKSWEKLEHLDDGLTSLDLIDAVPSYGDVYKMLLGSLDPDIDDIAYQNRTPVRSPLSPGGRDWFSANNRQPGEIWSPSHSFLPSLSEPAGPTLVIPGTSPSYPEPRDRQGLRSPTTSSRPPSRS